MSHETGINIGTTPMVIVSDTALDGAVAMAYHFFGEIRIAARPESLFTATQGNPGTINIYADHNGKWMVENQSGVQRELVYSTVTARTTS